MIKSNESQFHADAMIRDAAIKRLAILHDNANAYLDHLIARDESPAHALRTLDIDTMTEFDIDSHSLAHAMILRNISLASRIDL